MNRPPRPAGRAVARALRRHRRPVALLLLAAGTWSAVQAVAPPEPATRPVAVAARDLPSGAVLGADDVATVRLPLGLVPDGATAPSPGAALAAPVRRGEPFTDVRLAPVDGPRLPAGTVVVAVRTADPAAVLPVRAGDRVDVLAGPSADVGAGVGGGVGAGVGGDVGADVGSGIGGGGGPVAETLGRDLLVVSVPGRSGAGPTGDGGTGIDVDPALSGDDGRDGGGSGGGGLLDGMTGGGSTTSDGVDLAGVVFVAADRATAARLAAAVGVRSLTVAVTST